MMSTFKRLCLSWFLALGLTGPALAAASTLVQVDGTHYQLQVQSQLEPIAINRIHAWELELRDAQGTPVPEARITVDGGMPAHNHGLPTAPRVTEVLGPGRYLLEGVKFQMPGRWEMRFRVEADPGIETLTLPLDL
jgi:hypothetical protein